MQLTCRHMICAMPGWTASNPRAVGAEQPGTAVRDQFAAMKIERPKPVR